jgi:hypothetical protein
MNRFIVHVAVLPMIGIVMLIVAGRAQAQNGGSAPKSQQAAVDAPKADQVKFFEQQIRPILRNRCLRCHGGGKKIKGGLWLNTRARGLKGGDSGPAVELKKFEDSLLLDAINYGFLEMPPGGKLPAKEIALLTRWVKQGLPWTPGDKPIADPTGDNGSPKVNVETRNFWSFRRVTRSTVPAVKRANWVTNPIDAFVLAGLERAGLTPATSASRIALLRRACYDLTGLPPSPEEVRTFLADDSPAAYEKLIDRLLDSPQYGEKWARHWLDLVRYAETNSYERDGAKPNVWRYRDYVIRSLNEDKPYDRFLREQLAGDELKNVTPESIIATGYYRLGIWDDEPADSELALYDDLDDILKITAQVMLGMTINCARCHDHKLDPIPQKDYYRFLAFFGGVQRYGVRSFDTVKRQSLRPIATKEQQAARDRAVTAHQKRVGENDGELKAIEDVVRADFSPQERSEFRQPKRRIALVKKRVPTLIDQKKFDEYVALMKVRDELKRFRPPAIDMALCVTEIGAKPRPAHILIRGNPHAKGEPVQPGFPSIFDLPNPIISGAAAGAKTSGRRRVLAEWIASADNPRTSRVIVNRIWQYHFGRGIVRSPNDLGLQGTRPTHPKLLDWLAAEFIDRGWRMKSMHKLIMLSSAYRMSSRANPKSLARDPENNLFWRFSMRRLAAEEVRDSVLAVNGSLNRNKMFGPSIYPIIPATVLAGQSQPGAGWGKSSSEDRARRSIYIHVKRSLLVPVMESFDAADTDGSCPVRFSTTQPTQALGMLNGDFLNREAKVFADFLKKHAGDKPHEQVKLALRRALQREPSRQEIDRGISFISKLQQQNKTTSDQALRYFCLLSLNLNEFLYLD